jgi:Peptidase family M48
VQIYEDKPGNPNAFIFPDGKIYMSRWLLDICEYEEELLAVLAHEIRHHKEEHFVEKTRKAESKNNDSFLEKIRDTSGLGLLQEWRADIGWLIDLDNSGINPYWATIFFKKLSELQRKSQAHDFSFSHGSSNDRFLNTLSSARLYDFEHISETELTPFSSENMPIYANSKVKEIADISKILSPYDVSDRDWFDIKKKEIDKIATFQILAVLPWLKSKIAELYGTKVLDSVGTRMRRDDLQTLLSQTLDTLEDSIFADATFSMEEQSYIFGSIVELSTPNLVGGNIGPWEVLFQDIRSDLEDVLIKLDVNTGLEKLGDYLYNHELFLTKTPENFTKVLIKAYANAGTFLWTDEIFDYSIFLKFVGQCSQSLEELYSRCAISNHLYERENLIHTLCTWVIGEVENEAELARFAWENFRINISKDNFNITDSFEDIQDINDWGLQFAQKMQEKDYRQAISLLMRTIESTWEVDDTIINFTISILEALKKLPPENQLKNHYDNLAQLIAKKLVKRNPLEYIHIAESLSEKYRDKLILGDILFNTKNEIKYSSYEDIKKTYDAMFSFDGQHEPHWDEDNLNENFEDSVYTLALRAIREEDGIEKASDILKVGERDGIVKYNSKSVMNKRKMESYEDDDENDTVDTTLSLELATEYLKYIPDIDTASSINHLWQASKFFQDKVYQESLQKALMDRVLGTLSFEDGFSFVFNNDVPLEMIERFIDIRAKTHEQIERCKKEVLKKIQFEGKEWNITDYFIIYQLTKKRSKLDILFLALSTGENDMELKTLAFNDYHSYTSGKRDIAIECEKFYMMSETSKHILLRTLLTGKWGVLEDKKLRQLLLERLAKDHILNPDGEIESEVLKIFSMLLEEGKTEDLYFIFSSILKDRIFRRPKEPTSYLKVINEDPHIKYFLHAQMKDYRRHFADDKTIIERDSGYSFTVDWVPLVELLKEQETKDWYDDYMCDWYEVGSLPLDIAEYNAKVKIAKQVLNQTASNPFSQIYSQSEALCGGVSWKDGRNYAYSNHRPSTWEHRNSLPSDYGTIRRDSWVSTRLVQWCIWQYQWPIKDRSAHNLA